MSEAANIEDEQEINNSEELLNYIFSVIDDLEKYLQKKINYKLLQQQIAQYLREYRQY